MTQTTALTTRATDRAADAPLPKWRKAAVVLGALTAAAAPLAFALEHVHSGQSLARVPVVFWGALAVIAASGGIALSARLSAQLFARSIWWQVCLYVVASTAVVLGLEGMDGARFLGEVWPLLLMAVGAAAALAAAGRSGLSRESPLFAPAGFRAILIASIVLAMADTQALIAYAAIHAEDVIRHASYRGGYGSVIGTTALFAGCAAAMGTALTGLYRLKLWGFALNIAANLGVAALALSGALELPGFLSYMLAGTAALQLALPAPIVWRMAKNARAR